MKLGTGSNTERTQKYARVKVQNDIRTSKCERVWEKGPYAKIEIEI